MAERSLIARFRLLGGGFLLAIVTLGVFAFLADEVLEREAILLDADAGTFLHRFSSPASDTLMRAVSFVGSGFIIVPLALLTLIWLLRHRRAQEAAFLGIAVGGSAILNAVLKLFFHRARPDLAWSPSAATFSFPSGHAMNSLVCYLALAVVLWIVCGPRVGRAALLGASVLVFAIGVSRIYLGYHFLSDVVAGYSAGLCWVASVAVALEGRRLLRARRSALPPSDLLHPDPASR